MLFYHCLNLPYPLEISKQKNCHFFSGTSCTRKKASSNLEALLQFPPKGLFLGVLTQHYHSLFGSGSVYAVGRRRLVIEDLGYNDGEGGGGGGDGGDGDVFFYCGINGRPSPLGLRFGPELTGIGYRRRLVLK